MERLSTNHFSLHPRIEFRPSRMNDRQIIWRMIEKKERKKFFNHCEKSAWWKYVLFQSLDALKKHRTSRNESSCLFQLFLRGFLFIELIANAIKINKGRLKRLNLLLFSVHLSSGFPFRFSSCFEIAKSFISIFFLFSICANKLHSFAHIVEVRCGIESRWGWKINKIFPLRSTEVVSKTIKSEAFFGVILNFYTWNWNREKNKNFIAMFWPLVVALNINLSNLFHRSSSVSSAQWIRRRIWKYIISASIFIHNQMKSNRVRNKFFISLGRKLLNIYNEENCLGRGKIREISLNNLQTISQLF